MKLESYIQRCFAATLTGSVKPEEVIVGTKGPNGHYDCSVYDNTDVVASGTFYGDEHHGTVCITMVYDPASNHWSYPHTWRHFAASPELPDRLTSWPLELADQEEDSDQHD